VQDGDKYSGVSPQTGWSPQFTNENQVKEWLTKHGAIVTHKRFCELEPGDRLKTEHNEIIALVLSPPEKGTLLGMVGVNVELDNRFMKSVYIENHPDTLVEMA
jgi:hypothetical protein